MTADNIRRTDLQTSIVIYDLSKQENLPISLSLRRHCHSGTELIQALREPPDNICVQLVLWSSADYSLTQEMSDALVLGLKLDPKYLDEYEEMASMERMVHMSYHPRPMGFRTSQLKSVAGNGTIATLSQNFMPEAATAVPVLLVAFDRFSSHRDALFGQVLDGVDQGKPPINRSARGESKFFGGTEIDDQGERGQLYARIVQDFIVQGRDATSSNAFLLLAATSPLLYFNAYRIQEVSSQVRHTYDELTRGKIRGYRDLDTEYKNLDKDLGRERLKLRRTLEEAENHVSQFFRYLGSEVDSDWSKQPSYVSIKADWRSLIYEARRLEKEIRNYMQLQVGNLSLEESRRSIELSNIQIRESKSGESERSLCRLTLTFCSENLSVQEDVSKPSKLLTMF